MSAPRRSHTGLILGIAGASLLLLLGLALAGIFLVRSRIGASRPHIHTESRTESPHYGGRIGTAPAPSASHEIRSSHVQDEQVATDATQVNIPTTPVSGTLGGGSFEMQSCTLEGGVLRIKGGTGMTPEVVIFTFSRERPLGKRIVIPRTDGPVSGPVPHVHLRWSEGERIKTEILSRNYSMLLEFGQERDGKSPGKLYFEAPGRFQTKLQGSFAVE